MKRSSPDWSSGLSRFEASTVAPWADPAPEDGVHLVDEQDRVLALAQRRDQRLEARLEVAAIARAGEQRAEVEREDLGRAQVLGHPPLADPQREPLGERGLADPRLAHEERVVLAPARQDVDGALELGGAADQRVELALRGALREVAGVGGERVRGELAGLASHPLAHARARGRRLRAAPSRRFEIPCET